MTVQEVIALLNADALLYNAIVHGPVAGAGSTVDLGGGIIVPTIAKAISDLTADIIAGNANGYVATWADNAARALKVPEQINQIGIQADTKAIYYANGLAMGNWVFHPVQNTAADAAAAVAAVGVLTASLAGKMAIADYVGGAAAGIVRTATRLALVADFIAANANSSQHALVIENGVLSALPLLQNNRCTSLIDGAADHTTLANTSRRCFGVGTNFAFVNAPKRLISWGAQIKGGILGSGIAGTQSYHTRATIAVQQPDRALPGFDPAALYTAVGQVVQVISQGAVTVALTADGIVMACGMNGVGVKALFGSGVDKLQVLFMPIYFNNGGANQPIVMMDVQDSTTGNNGTAVFGDDLDNVWLLTNNPANAGYGNGLAGAINTPVKLNPGFPSWAGKLLKKIRCDCTGNIYILFTNGELWAGGGSNATGQLGTGSTAAVLNPLQILTDVDDFDVSGQEAGTTLALWVLQDDVLKGAGYNANGQLGQVAGPTANKTSFVTVATGVDLVRIGGTDNVTVIYRDTLGTFHGLGRNTDGQFGEGTSGNTNNVAVVLANLTLIVADNGGLVDLCLSGFNGKIAACVVCANGKAFACGNNTDGVLANGTEAATNTWGEVLWSPREQSGEKIVDVSSAFSTSSGPAFTWRTNHGRVLQAGPADKGFSTGVTPQSVYNQRVASPVQIGTV